MNLSPSHIESPVVEVFKTNVDDPETARRLLDALHLLYPDVRFNFALDDCDRILRAESSSLDFTCVADYLRDSGYYCEVLE